MSIGIETWYAGMWFIGRPCGHNDGDHLLGHVDDWELEELWAEARNATRWTA
jgi:hypothetical protein